MKLRLTVLALLSAGQLFAARINPVSNEKFMTDVNGNGKNISNVLINGLSLIGSGGPFTFSGTGTILTTNGVGSNLTVNAAGFNGNLTPTDDTVQEIAQKLDDLTITGGGGITDIVNDLTPQLGGDLDLNGHVILGMVIGTNIEAHTLALSQWAVTTGSTAIRAFIQSASSANLFQALTTKNGASTGKVLFADGTINITAGQTINVTVGGTIGGLAYKAPTTGTLIQKADGLGGLIPVNPNEVFSFTEPGFNFVPYHLAGSSWNTAKLDTDGTMAADTDINISTQHATKTYVDNKFITTIVTTPYNATTWDGDTTHTAALDVLRDKFESLGTGGGAGTVTSFSAGALAPLFTTSVATATTTPALTFTIGTIGAASFLGNSLNTTGPIIEMTGGVARGLMGLSTTDKVQFADVQLATSTLTYGGTTTIDFNTGGRFRTLALTGDALFQTSNLQAGKVKQVRITCDGTTRNMVFPSGWTWVGGVAPGTIPASQSAILTLTSYATTDAFVVAEYKLKDFSASGITDIVQDTTPQLGGDLDLNGHMIVDVPQESTPNTFASENTFTGGIVSSGSSVTSAGNMNAPAWTNNGIKFKQTPATITDTTSAGAVGTGVTNNFGGNTIAASTATTFTNYYETYFKDPTQGTNVTMGSRYAIGADSFKTAGVAFLGNTTITGTAALTGVTTPAVLTTDQSDYNPPNLNVSTTIRQDGGAADRLVTGLSGGASGRIINFINIGTTNNITLKNQDSGSSGVNRFISSGDIVLQPNQSITLRYDVTTQRWRPLNLSAAGSESSNSVPNGKMGVTSLTPYAIIYGGTTSTGAVQSGTLGTAGQGLTSNGAGALPTFQDRPAVSFASAPVDMKVTGNTVVYTVPAGKTFTVMNARVITATFTGTATVHAAASLISGAGDVLTGAPAFTGGAEVVGKGKDLNAAPSTVGTVAAGDVVNLNVGTASNATTHTAYVVIQGVLF